MVPFLLCVGLICLTLANNYITARYFHSKAESLAAVITGVMIFEIPLCMWLMQSSGYSIFVIGSKPAPSPKELKAAAAASSAAAAN